MRTAGEGRRRRVATALTVLAALAGVMVLAPRLVGQGGSAENVRPAAVRGGAVAGADLGRTIQAAHERLRVLPEHAPTWAQLGGAYVEQARVTADPTYYGRAESALRRSLQLRPQGNGAALLGMGALANARHDFAAARDWAVRARVELPDTAAVHGVLADALTQLGDADGATAAVQRMLDLRPSVASFTRASYDLQLRGRNADAQAAMQRALQGASTADEIAFCRYHLGELAFDAGALDEAAQHYEQGLLAAPDSGAPGNGALRQGVAKIAGARGDLTAAVDGYRSLVAALPLPQYLQEYAVWLTAAGQPARAAEQYRVLAQVRRLAEAAGATDDLTAATIAADQGDAALALRLATAEWQRRQHVLVADAMAWALYLSGQHAQALPYADRAAALGTVDATFAYHRGMILRGLGRHAEAAQQLDAALRINPYFSPVHAPLARQALAQLRGSR